MSGDGEKQLNVRIDSELFERIRELSERDERSISGTIRHALRLYCKECEQ